MDAWIRGYEHAVRAGVVGPKLWELPPAAYDDEREWNRAYVALHDLPTAGPLVHLVHRFARALRPEWLSLEHRAFAERVAIDGLERNPPRLNPHHEVMAAARLFETLAWIRRDQKLAAYAEMFCTEKPLEDDADAYAAVVLHRAFAGMTGRTAPGAVARLAAAVGATRFSNWRRTHEALRVFAQRFDKWAPEERRAIFDRFVHAAGVADDPHPWLEAAASLYASGPGAKSTPALRAALRRVESHPFTGGLCDPWYVRRLNSFSPFTE